MLPTSWRRLLSLIRIVLGMSCLTIQLISSSFAVTDTVILFAGYTIYAFVTLFWRSLEDSGYPTLSLILDFVFFCSHAERRGSAARPDFRGHSGMCDRHTARVSGRAPLERFAPDRALPL